MPADTLTGTYRANDTSSVATITAFAADSIVEGSLYFNASRMRLNPMTRKKCVDTNNKVTFQISDLEHRPFGNGNATRCKFELLCEEFAVLSALLVEAEFEGLEGRLGGLNSRTVFASFGSTDLEVVDLPKRPTHLFLHDDVTRCTHKSLCNLLEPLEMGLNVPLSPPVDSNLPVLHNCHLSK